MKLEEKEVTLRKLTASEGKVIISKETDEKGKPIVVSKEIYLSDKDSEDNYEEVEETIVEETEAEEEG